MELYISFDFPDLDQALAIAERVEPYATGFDVGSLLLYKYGVQAIEQFRTQFKNKIINVDAKLVVHGKETVALFAQAGADSITVMGGTRKEVIHAACTQAHTMNKRVLLDVSNASAYGQIALEAQSMGADGLLLRTMYDANEQLLFKDQWTMIRGNTPLPIYLTGKISLENIDNIREIQPNGVFVGRAITQADNPQEVARLLKEKM
ncbi:MAG: orotidine 5'-phosphate decarboxylase / HUMPS family protein [Candidatus Babeliales bacterium]